MANMMYEFSLKLDSLRKFFLSHLLADFDIKLKIRDSKRKLNDFLQGFHQNFFFHALILLCRR